LLHREGERPRSDRGICERAPADVRGVDQLHDAAASAADCAIAELAATATTISAIEAAMTRCGRLDNIRDYRAALLLGSEVDLLGDTERIIDLNAEVANSAFELHVPEQQLHRS